MANINLRPWREERRARRAKDFGLLAIVVLGLSVGAAFGWYKFTQGQIDGQNSRNQYLEQKIAILDIRIAEIEALKRELEQLTERMEIIQNLEAERTEIVYAFDEFVKHTPDDIYLTSIDLKGMQYTIRGISRNHSVLSRYIEGLESRSLWFSNALLPSSGAIKNSLGEVTAREFEITANRSKPKKRAEEEK